MLNFLDNMDDYIKTETKKHVYYTHKLPFTFDTETSHNHDEDNPLSWVYSWAICWDAKHEDHSFGRNISQFIALLKSLDFKLTQLSSEFGGTVKVVIYVHNLSYDYIYIYPWINQQFKIKSEFYIDKKHILRASIGDHMILKDSLVYFNMSLAEICDNYPITHIKQIGTVDYNAIHYSTDELDGADIKYQLYDVYSLQEALIIDFELNNYDVTTAPLTSTGKVRKICHTASDKCTGARDAFLQTQPHPIYYKLMRKVFAGGYTHGNRFWREKTVNAESVGEDPTTFKIGHRDFRSAYPSMMRKIKYPIGEIKQLKHPTIEDFYKEDKCTWGLFGADSVKLRDKMCPYPFLSRSKCDTESGCFITDNGRVLECDDKFTFYACDYDIRILQEVYEFENLQPLWVCQTDNAPLPEWFTAVIDYYYKEKSDLKVQVKKLRAEGAPRDVIYDAEMRLLRAKRYLNSLYGMSAMDYCKPEFKRDKNGEVNATDPNYYKLIRKHYGIYHGEPSEVAPGFLPYQWAIYVTAGVRYELYQRIKICGYNFLYADTDSIFYISTPEIEKKFDDLNKLTEKNALNKGMYITTEDGKIVTYDSFDVEDFIKEFRFLHSKCYAYIDNDNKLNVTIAGVSNRKLDKLNEDGSPHYYYSSDELGDINNLSAGFTFKKCGSTLVTYYQRAPDLIEVASGKYEHVSDGAIISENTKTLTVGDEDFILMWHNELINRGIYHF